MTAGTTAPAPPGTAERDFLAPAVERAVASLRLPGGAWVLDVGAGCGTALPALARAAGSAGRVHAVDTDPGALDLAGAHVARHGMTHRVSIRRADPVDVLEHAATEPGGGFDAIWSAAVGPDTFADPAAGVAAMARALRPGGVLALFHPLPDQAVFLPGHARLERLARAATSRAHGTAADPERLHDRHPSWLAAAGLSVLTLDVFPRIALHPATDRTARDYLADTVWPQMWDAALACGPGVGMTDADLAELHALLTPGGRRYALDDPGHHVLYPTLLATGRQHAARR